MWYCHPLRFAILDLESKKNELIRRDRLAPVFLFMAKKIPKSKTSAERPSSAHAGNKDVQPGPKDLGAGLGDTIRAAAPAIVEALIEEAKHGNCTPAKFLFEFAGLSCAASADVAAEESLAALLLRELTRRTGQPEESVPVQ